MANFDLEIVINIFWLIDCDGLIVISWLWWVECDWIIVLCNCIKCDKAIVVSQMRFVCCDELIVIGGLGYFDYDLKKIQILRVNLYLNLNLYTSIEESCTIEIWGMYSVNHRKKPGVGWLMYAYYKSAHISYLMVLEYLW